MYFDVRTWCDRQIFYVLETGTRVLVTSIMCKVSRCNSTKLEAIQARHHTQHATTYNSAKLEQAPLMVH